MKYLRGRPRMTSPPKWQFLILPPSPVTDSPWPGGQSSTARCALEKIGLMHPKSSAFKPFRLGHFLLFPSFLFSSHIIPDEVSQRSRLEIVIVCLLHLSFFQITAGSSFPTGHWDGEWKLRLAGAVFDHLRRWNLKIFFHHAGGKGTEKELF